MSISLQNVENRLRILEEKHNHKFIKNLKTHDDKFIVRVGSSATITDDALPTANWLLMDWIMLDDYNVNTTQTHIIPLFLLRLTQKNFFVCENYRDGYDFQSLEISYEGDRLEFKGHGGNSDGSSPIYVRWLSIFKYYLNIVFGLVM